MINAFQEYSLKEHGCEYWVDCNCFERIRCQCLHDVCKIREKFMVEAKEKTKGGVKA